MENSTKAFFTKEDYLSAFQIAKRYNLPRDVVATEMRVQYLKGATVLVKNNKHPMIYRMKNLHRKNEDEHTKWRVHPLGLERLLELVQERIKRQKTEKIKSGIAKVSVSSAAKAKKTTTTVKSTKGIAR